MSQSVLESKLRDRTAKIGIIGLGYVGLPLALRYSKAGLQVVGVDLDRSKIDKLNQGKSYIERIPDAVIADTLKANFQATSDFAVCKHLDALIVCVPTPLTKHREPDLSLVRSAIERLEPYLHKGLIVSLESTTYPGTTEEEFKPRIENSGFKIGKDIFLVYSPEREDPGNEHFSTHNIPKIVGGYSQACLDMGLLLYGLAIEKVVPVSSLKTAEMTKLLENIHRSVNIGLVNEMKIVADKMGIDIFEVIEAASTKPFGFTPYFPGPGLGGHCIPVDPFYLTWKAREYGVNTRFIELAGEVNSSMPRYVVGKVVDALNKNKKAVSGSRILVLGAAYKKNIDDMRESPSLDIISLLLEQGAEVSYADPHVPVIHVETHAGMEKLSSVDVGKSMLAAFDCVLIATNHDKFPYDDILKHARLIVDSRGVWRQQAAHLFKA